MDIYIHQDKFHQVVLKQFHIKKMNKEEQTIRRFLCYYQELACNKYPSESKMNEVLGELYDAKFHVTLTSFGSYSLFIYSLTAVDPKYIEDEEYTLEKLEEIFTELTYPCMAKTKANLSVFNRAYEIYESDLLSILENTQAVAYQEAVLEYFKGTDRAFYSYGSLEELSRITPKKLFDYYQTLQKEETISICTGHIPSSKKMVDATLTPKKNYHFKDRGTPPSFIRIPNSSKQCYLHIIYETNIFADDPLYYACMCLNHILGGNSSSYLFGIVREKYGLCYSIHSTYLAASGIIILSCTLDPSSLNQGLEAIEEAFKELPKLNFDLEETKKHFISNHYLGEDYIDTAIQNYLSDHYFLDTPKSTKEVEALKHVSKQDILSAFHKLTKTFTYVYGGKKNG